jgi:hypothetical protein
MFETARAAVPALVLTLAVACGDGPATPAAPAPSPVPPAPPSRPVLLAPEADAVIPQNDPATGCAVVAGVGAGHRVVFDWADVDAPAGLARYEIHVQHEGSVIPIVDTITQASQHVYVACSAYVADPNLEDWVWKVRAVDARGQASEWSERRYSYAPCRIGRRPCGF